MTSGEPPIAGNDLRTMSREAREVVSSGKVVAVELDTLGAQRVPSEAATVALAAWLEPLADCDSAAASRDRGTSTRALAARVPAHDVAVQRLGKS